MSFKTILVQAEPDPERVGGLLAALSVARSFGATVVGVGVASLGEFLEPEPARRKREPAVVTLLRQEIEANLEQAERLFREVAGSAGAPVRWRCIAARPAEALVRAAAGADLLVLRSGDDDARAEVGAVVMGAGAPVLLAPAGRESLSAETVVVGWKNTREARRAIGDALPFLQRAKRTILANFQEPGAAPAAEEEVEDVLSRLERHGVAAAVSTLQVERTHPADLLIRLAEQEGADLIVAGGYGHNRLQDWVFGGVTEQLIRRSPVFVLLSR